MYLSLHQRDVLLSALASLSPDNELMHVLLRKRASGSVKGILEEGNSLHYLRSAVLQRNQIL